MDPTIMSTLQEPPTKILKTDNTTKVDYNTELIFKQFQDTIELQSSFSWIIDDFNKVSELLKPEEYIKSRQFTLGANQEFEWCLMLYPKGCKPEFKEYISLFLVLSKKQIEYSSKLFITACVNNHLTQGNKTVIMSTDTDKLSEPIGFTMFVKKAYITYNPMNFLPDGKLRIEFNLTMNQQQSLSPKFSLFNDLKSLLDSSMLSDLTLNVGDKKIQVHKNILAARSDVFAAMFTNDMKEKDAKEIGIVDVKPNVMEELLHFTYVGTITNPTYELLMDLIPAADKYNVHGLMCFCEISMSQKLTSENVIDVLKLAQIHNAKQLIADALNFIDKHAEQVASSSAFTAIAEVQFETVLLAAVIRKMAANKK